MYLDHFGLKRYPFRLSPDIDFLYMSRGHARAKAYLDYTVVSLDGFVVVTGEVGAGKTTLLNKLIDDLSDDVLFLRVDQTQLSDTEFLQAMLAEAGVSAEVGGKVQLHNALKDFLVEQVKQGRRVALAVDEAQALDRKVLEEIRQLSGLEYKKERLLSVILLGQPELGDVIDAPGQEQLAQRVRLRFHLDALTPEETREYVVYRMRVAGAERDDIFGEDAYPKIDLFTGGIPRLVNSLCDMALLTTYVDSAPQVTAETVESAASELNWEPFTARPGARGALRGGLANAGSGSGGRGEGPGLDPAQCERLINAIEDLAVAVRAGFAEMSAAPRSEEPASDPEGEQKVGSVAIRDAARGARHTSK